VLVQFLPECNAGRLKEMFGPVERYVMERGATGAGVVMSAPGGSLVQEVF
jgi:hypothetical protein